MTRTNLILTHASVFAVGIAATVITTGLHQPGGQAGAGFQTENFRSGRSSPALAQPNEQASPRFNRDAPGDPRAKNSTEPPVERLAGIVRITDVFERQKALMELIESLGPDQFAAVAEQYRELDHLGDSGGEYSLILRGWAKADPLAALEYVAQLPNSRAGSATVLATWAGNEPAAALLWATQHHEGEGPNPFMASVIRGIAGNDVAEASRLAQAMPNSRERGEAVDAITQALFLQGTDAAMAFPDSIREEQLRGGFVAAIANRLIAKDVNKAAEWIASMPQGDIQNRAARNVGEALAKQNPAQAAAWIDSLKPEAKVEAARGVIPLMSSADIAGTATWVASLAGTPNYDLAVEEFVWSCNTRAPEQSAAWIMGISNPDQQRRLFHRMLGEWAQRDATAVKQWVASNEVPQDVRRRFSR
jgi:hypothetical protein